MLIYPNEPSIESYILIFGPEESKKAESSNRKEFLWIPEHGKEFRFTLKEYIT